MLLAVGSCQKHAYVSDGGIQSTNASQLTTKSSCGDLSSNELAYEFLASSDPELWGSIVGLENRFAACDFPDNVLDQMDTKTMANLIIHYPLNYLIFTYEEPITAVNLIFGRSDLHKHFLKRPDSSKIIAEIYSNSAINMSPKTSNYDGRLDTLSYVNEMLLDYLVASGLLTDLNSTNYKEMVSLATERKIIERESDPDTFSSNSLLPLRIASDMLMSTTYQIIRTYFTQELHGMNLDEYSNSELINITNDLVSNYPNAILRGPATHKYNCHSYAWHQQSVNNTIWLNRYYNGSLQLSKYWTNDLYVSCLADSAEKVYYSDGDHSAIVLSNGKYRSKWGGGPLMEHDPDDCPYATTNMQFYKERTTPLTLSINGSHSVIIGQTNQYSFNLPYYNFGADWDVVFMGPSSSAPFTFTITSNTGHYLVCNEPGLYVMTADHYRNNILIAHAQADIVATPY